MAEPIRKPIHRPRPPHPHTQKRPQAAVVRSGELSAEMDADRILRRPAPVRPALVPAPPPPAALAPPEERLAAPRFPEERSARSLLLTALALHVGVLITAWSGQPAQDLLPADLLLSGAVLLSGGVMLVLGGLRR